MKTIFRIAQTELRLFFYSPIAWLVLIIFAFQAGISFSDTFCWQLQNKALGYMPLPYQTMIVLLGDNGAFFRMLSALYLYIPLLSMALMSSEYSSGSVKLLYSSPVTNGQIVAGKYLSMLLYGLLLIGILTVQATFAAFAVKNLDIPLVLSGLLGIYLVIGAYSAIGLFMSSLTPYQIVSAVGTLVVLTFLNFVGGLWQDIPFVRDITWWLSISGRAKTFIDGLICSEDVIYFLVVIGLFVGLAILKLQAGKKHDSYRRQIIRYGSVVAVALGIGYLTSLPAFMGYYDTTRDKHNTIPPKSREIMEQLKGGLKITMYVNLLERNYWQGMPSRVKSNFRELRPFVRFKPETKMEYVYYYDHSDNSGLDEQYPELSDKKRMLKICDDQELDPEMFLTPEQLKSRIDLSPEGNRLIYVLERENGQRSFLRFYDDMNLRPSENEITIALKQLVMKSPKVAFLTGHGERNIYRKGDDGYYTLIARNFRHSLLNLGFTPDTLSLAANRPIPEDVDILVIADPRTEFTETEREQLNAYITWGGNLILAGEPDRAGMLNQLTYALGIEFTADRVVQKNYPDYAPDLIVGEVTDESAGQLGLGAGIKSRDYQAVFTGTSALTYQPEYGFRMIPVIVTPAVDKWIEKNPDSDRKNRPEAGKTNDNLNVMLALTRQLGNKEQRIVVSGDADWMSVAGMSTNRNGIRGNNFGLMVEMFHYLAYEEFPVDTSRPEPIDDDLCVSPSIAIAVKGFFMGLFPLVLIGVGVGIWIRRRKR